MPDAQKMFCAENILATANRLGVKLALIRDRYWIDPILMRVTVADPVTVMLFDWLRGQEDAMFTDLVETGNEWAEFWFHDVQAYWGLSNGMYNIEHYDDNHINITRAARPVAYDLGYEVRLELLTLGAITEGIQEKVKQ